MNPGRCHAEICVFASRGWTNCIPILFSSQNMSTFSSISPNYQQRATLQQSAAEKLFELLAIKRTDSVLDLGCGPGHLTRRIRDLTSGVVFGLDPSAAMIAKARRNCQTLAVTFLTTEAESFETPQQFDVIFCNSSFQWLRDPVRALNSCNRVLRPGGRIGIQAPARANYCPNFTLATQALLADPRTREVFAHFVSPWFFLETPDDYARLFETAGMPPEYCQIEEINELCAPDKVMLIFESGAAAGYLNPASYKVAPPPNYFELARHVIKSSFQTQATENGKVPLQFSRVYLLAQKS